MKLLKIIKNTFIRIAYRNSVRFFVKKHMWTKYGTEKVLGCKCSRNQVYLEVLYETSRKEIIMAEEKKEILKTEPNTDKLFLVEDGDESYYVDEEYLCYMNSLGLVR